MKISINLFLPGIITFKYKTCKLICPMRFLGMKRGRQKSILILIINGKSPKKDKCPNCYKISNKTNPENCQLISPNDFKI